MRATELRNDSEAEFEKLKLQHDHLKVNRYPPLLHLNILQELVLALGSDRALDHVKEWHTKAGQLKLEILELKRDRDNDHHTIAKMKQDLGLMLYGTPNANLL